MESRHPIRSLTRAAFLFALLAGRVSATPCPPHPRLIVGPVRIARLKALAHPQNADTLRWTDREKVSVLALRSILDLADRLRREDPASSIWTLQQGYQLDALMTLGMAHLLTQGNDPSIATVYSDRVVAFFDSWMAHDFPMWAGSSDRPFSELPAGELLAGWSLAFDWIYPVLSPAQRRSYARAILDLLDRMTLNPWIANAHDNNHGAIGYGGRGLGALALEGEVAGRDEARRIAILGEASRKVRWYLDDAYPVDGAGIEGDWYSSYGLNVALPFALAADRLTHLPDSLRIHVADRRTAQQAGTWLLYEQDPSCPYRGAPLNDTFLWTGTATGYAPEEGMNPVYWRAWPWLLAFGDASRPSAALQLFRTQFRPRDIDAALSAPFRAGAPGNDPRAILFSHRGAGMEPDRYLPALNAVPILLGWPEDDVPASAFTPQDSLPSSRAFVGRGLAIFRSSVLRVDDRGGIAPDSSAWRITFECRNPAAWSADGHHNGHAQFDLNHFTIAWKGEDLFFDSGYERYGSHTTDAHNIHEIQVDGAWRGFYDKANREGLFLRSLFGAGRAPSMAAGDNTRAWNRWEGGAKIVERSQRHFFVLPRGTGRPPYVLFHDDLAFAGGREGSTRWFWHSNAPSPAAFSIDAAARTAVLRQGGAAAAATILSPSTIAAMTQDVYRPRGAPPHDRLVVETGPRRNADLIVLIDLHDAGSRPAIVATALPSHPSDGHFAYRIADGGRNDLVAFRRGDAPGVWTVDTGGHTLETDAQQVILRFRGPNVAWGDIDAGMMVQGSRVALDGRVVVSLDATSAERSIVFSPEEASVTGSGAGGAPPRYLVGPFVPRRTRAPGGSR